MSALIWAALAVLWASTAPIAQAAGTSRRPAIEQQWKSSDCGIADAKQVVIRTREDWAALWQVMHRRRLPTPPLPDVDFAHQTVLGVFLGERPGGGSGVEITSITQHGDTLVVAVKETSPPPHTFQTMALTQPCHVVVVNAPAASVQFRFR